MFLIQSSNWTSFSSKNRWSSCKRCWNSQTYTASVVKSRLKPTAEPSIESCDVGRRKQLAVTMVGDEVIWPKKWAGFSSECVLRFWCERPVSKFKWQSDVIFFVPWQIKSFVVNVASHSQSKSAKKTIFCTSDLSLQQGHSDDPLMYLTYFFFFFELLLLLLFDLYLSTPSNPCCLETFLHQWMCACTIASRGVCFVVRTALITLRRKSIVNSTGGHNSCSAPGSFSSIGLDTIGDKAASW